MIDTYHKVGQMHKVAQWKRKVGTAIVGESLKGGIAQWLRAWKLRSDGTELKFHFYHLLTL